MLATIAPGALELEFPPIGEAVCHGEVEIGRRAVDFKLTLVAAYNLIHRLDRSIWIADERTLTVHVADFDQPWLCGPAIRCSRIFVEHCGSIVHLRSSVLAFVCHQSLDCWTHPRRCSRTVGFQLGDPPVLVCVFIVAELVHRLLRPMALVLDVGSEADLERTHVCHAFGRLGTHRQAIAHCKKESN